MKFLHFYVTQFTKYPIVQYTSNKDPKSYYYNIKWKMAYMWEDLFQGVDNVKVKQPLSVEVSVVDDSLQVMVQLQLT